MNSLDFQADRGDSSLIPIIKPTAILSCYSLCA